MTQADDLPRDPAASEQTPPPETLPTEPPQALTLPEAMLPPETPEPLAADQPEDGLLDVDYVFPSHPEMSGGETTTPELHNAEVLGSSDVGESQIHSDGSGTSETPLALDAPPIPESATPSASPDPVAALPATQSAVAEAASAPAAPPSVPEAVAVEESSDLSSFSTGELEEETYAPTVAVQGPQAGEVISGYQLNQDLGRGWFSANALGAGPSVDVYVRPAPLWAGLRPHRLLPKVTPAGDLLVLAPTDGTPLTPPLDPATAQAYVTELARLLFALEKQGYAVTDLDPASVHQTRDGLKLRMPPQVARLGEAVQPTLRDSFTPPEVQEGQPAQAKSGVYLLGALFFQWLTQQPLPAEGPSSVVLAGINASGVPQLLNGMLAPLPQRLSPTELLAALKTAATTLPVYQLAAATDIGLNPERPTNEDSYGFVWKQIGQHGGGNLILRAVVSDGMGGMAAGEVASQAAVRAFLASEALSFEASALEAQVWEANAAVLTDMKGRDGGCTFTGVEIRGTQLHLGHVGDTRAYIAQGGAVVQLSKDHSYVAAMVASGQMTPEEAQVSPERNKVLRSLGSLRAPQDDYVQVLPEPLELPVGSRVLLLSDGVWGEMLPPVIHDILLHEPSLQRIVDHLIELSLASGAPDNATALVIERVR
ncbi:protein phosphatase 2C domain-containing protein [Deinococcus sp. QL22]|uniref:protein phosphatase 2C domain-containing protein n=1 Tax=Deinococcus sp. QL22 TaxID=2939437 RepID=UPI002017FF03|nr:protein phosphatase 2C domain-containing protein [Deinococcus sp. QL22]UQN08356.1 protein phosphatase 2C domain-containing protein [Deinococcus sp. QL22]